jgi:hypothetical protein
MKLTIEAYDTKVEITTKADDLTVMDVFEELVIPALVGVTFTEETILDGMEEVLSSHGREAGGCCGCDDDKDPWAVGDPDNEGITHSPGCACGDPNCLKEGYGYYKIGGTD